jgi:hypothetical protein
VPDRRLWLALGLSQLLFLVVLAPLVYYETFSIFQRHDDEGYMMMTVKHMLAGHRLYDEVWTLYGPIYFVYKWLVHGLAGLPLTHDVVRLTACAMRLAIGVVASLAAFGLTRNVPLAAAAQVLVTAYLMAIRNEPGHPQELAGLLTMGTVAIPALARSRGPRPIAVLLGVAIGLLAMVKVNLGVFAGVAVAMALLCAVRRTRPIVALQIVFGALLAMLPWAFMRVHLDFVWTFNLAAVETSAMLALSVLAVARTGGGGRSGDLAWYAAACVGTVVLIALGTMLAGSSVHALVDCLILTPMRMPGLFFHSFALWRPWIGALAVVLALVGRLAERRLPESVVGSAKLLFGIFTCAAAWQRDDSALAGVVTPFLWLTLLAPRDGRDSTVDFFARLVLCWTAALNLLQTYPVAGSQVVFGNVLHVLCGIVCLGDAVRWLGSYAIAPVGPWARRAVSATLVLVLVVLCARAGASEEFGYRTVLVPLGLPGAERIHLPAEDVSEYQLLAQFLRDRAHTLFSLPGFNSLYFWTGTEPPTLDVIGHVMSIYSPERWTAMVDALASAPKPMVVRFRGLAPPAKSFAKRLDLSFAPVVKIGRYRVLALRPTPVADP